MKNKKIAILFESREQLLKYSRYKNIPLIDKNYMDFPYFKYNFKGNVVNCLVGSSCSYIASSLEELSDMGYTYVIRIGTCGGLQKDVSIGDIVIVSSSIKGEGVSNYYLPKEFPAVCNLDIFEIKKVIEKIGKCHIGNVYSASARYRQKKEAISAYRDLGTIAIDMETSSFYSVSIFKKLYAVSILFVTDSLIENNKGILNSLDLHMKIYPNMNKVIEEILEFWS